MSTLETPLDRETVGGRNGAVSTQGMLDVNAAAYQAFWLLRIGFTVAPILFGIDKFFNWTVTGRAT